MGLRSSRRKNRSIFRGQRNIAHAIKRVNTTNSSEPQMVRYQRRTPPMHTSFALPEYPHTAGLRILRSIARPRQFMRSNSGPSPLIYISNDATLAPSTTFWTRRYVHFQIVRICCKLRTRHDLGRDRDEGDRRPASNIDTLTPCLTKETKLVRRITWRRKYLERVPLQTPTTKV